MQAVLDACREGDVARVQGLVVLFPELLTAAGPRGATTLHAAARFGHESVTRTLVDLGAPVPGGHDANGRTAEAVAERWHHQGVCQFLREARLKRATEGTSWEMELHVLRSLVSRHLQLWRCPFALSAGLVIAVVIATACLEA